MLGDSNCLFDGKHNDLVKRGYFTFLYVEVTYVFFLFRVNKKSFIQYLFVLRYICYGNF